jgi:hypothetical protein
MTTIFREAFGTFEPHTDKDAVAKIALDVLVSTGRGVDLLELLTDGVRLGGMQGEPG